MKDPSLIEQHLLNFLLLVLTLALALTSPSTTPDLFGDKFLEQQRGEEIAIDLIESI